MLRNHVMAVETGWQFGPARPLKMVAESISIPKEDSDYPRGDYASFISADKQSVGVADGEYASQLMSLVKENHNNIKKSPKRVLEEAYSKTTVEGSSTACIVSFSGEDRVLRAANVGGSGFQVIRNGAVVYRSPKDDPSVAEEIEFPGLIKGDLVLLGTDRVLDNVHESDILEFLAMPWIDLAEACCLVANIAIYNSFDRFIPDTPYSIEETWAGEEGGKIDDITLVIARIE